MSVWMKSYGVTIQMQTAAVLSCGTFIMLCKVVLPFESLDKIVCCDLLMKAFEQYFALVLFIML